MIRGTIGVTLGALALFFLYWGIDVAITIPDDASVAVHLIAGLVLVSIGMMLAGGAITVFFFLFKRS